MPITYKRVAATTLESKSPPQALYVIVLVQIDSQQYQGRWRRKHYNYKEQKCLDWMRKLLTKTSYQINLL